MASGLISCFEISNPSNSNQGLFTEFTLLNLNSGVKGQTLPCEKFTYLDFEKNPVSTIEIRAGNRGDIWYFGMNTQFDLAIKEPLKMAISSKIRIFIFSHPPLTSLLTIGIGNPYQL